MVFVLLKDYANLWRFPSLAITRMGDFQFLDERWIVGKALRFTSI